MPRTTSRAHPGPRPLTDRSTGAGGLGSAGMRGISKRFGAVRALGSVTLDFPGGQVTAPTGENGAGKSTPLKILTGDHRPTEGHIVLDGHRVDLALPGALENGLTVRGTKAFWQNVARGSHLVVAVVIQQRRNGERAVGLPS